MDIISQIMHVEIKLSSSI